MNYLLDTNVLTEIRRKQPNDNVVRWLEQTPEDYLYVSILNLAEIRKGIAKLEVGQQRNDLMQWLYDALATRFAGRILAIDLETALLWGQLAGQAERRGQPLPAIDTLLAATAIRHELILVTRNQRDFRRIPVAMYNPWLE